MTRDQLLADLKWWVGLVLSLAVSLAGQAEVFPEPWRHYVSVAGIVATAITAYAITPRPVENSPPR